MKTTSSTTIIGYLATLAVLAGALGCDGGPEGAVAVAGDKPVAKIQQAQTPIFDAPTNLWAQYWGNGRVHFGWTDNSNVEDRFEIWRSDHLFGTWQYVGGALENGTQGDDWEASEGGEYTYWVYALQDGVGYSEPSNGVYVRLHDPEAPSNLTASMLSPGFVRLDWWDNSPDELYFYVYRSTTPTGFSLDNPWCVLEANVNTCNLSDPATSGDVYYQVRGINIYGLSPPSNTVSLRFGTPAAPSNLSGSANGGWQVDLSWTDNASNEDGFQIDRLIGSTVDRTFWADPNQTWLTDLEVSPGNTYTYRVRAWNGFGNSSWTSTITVMTPSLPSAPTNLVATPASGSSIGLTWTDTSSNETSFELERWNGSTLERTWTVGANVASTTDTGLVPGTTYGYWVRALNSVGASFWSNGAWATTPTPPAAPSNLTGTIVSGTRIDLAWWDNSWDETRFRVERSTDGTNYTSVGTPGADATTFSNTSGLTSGTTYRYRVRAENLGGNSAYSNVVTIPLVAPSAPTGVRPDIWEAGRINVSWQDTSSNEGGFRLERQVAGGSWATVTECAAVPAGQTWCDDRTGFTAGTTYGYRVVAFNGVGSTTSTSSSVVYAVPAAPTNLTAVISSPTRINVSWTVTSVNASGICLAIWLNGTFNRSECQGPTANSYADTQVMAGNTYEYRAWAWNGLGGSDYSNAAIVPVQIPTAPNNLVARVISATRVDLTWSDLSTSEAGFRVERANNGSSTWASVTGCATLAPNTQACSDTNGLTSGSTYQYRVVAYNVLGNGTSAVVTATIATPPAPSNLTGQVTSATQVTLSWRDNSTNEQGFKVERSTDNGTSYTQVTTTNADVTTYADGGRTANSTVLYRVRAYNGVGNSSYTSVLTIRVGTPTAPSGLAGTMGPSLSINLTWTDASNNESGFIIGRSTDNTTFTDLPTLAANTTSFNDPGRTAGLTYWYRIRAINGAGASANSNTVSVSLVPPAAPTNLVGQVASSTQINLSWTDNATTEDGFRVERSTDGSTFTVINSPPANATGYNNTGLTSGATYHYRVKAYNAIGDSAYSNVVTVAVNPPAAPSNLVAWAGSTTSAVLKWTDNADNETGFKIERSTTSATSGFSQVGTVNANVTTYTNTGLTASTNYWYRVRATNGRGDSAYSNVAATRTATPSAPSNLVATLVTASRIDLSWNDNSNNERDFEIEVSTTGTFAKIFTTAPDVRSWTHNGVLTGTTYTYRVRATNGAGNSGYSNTAVVAVTVPATPTGLTATVAGIARVDLAWTDAASNEASYAVERSADNVTFATLTDTLPAGSVAYADTTVIGSAVYYYRIIARNIVGPSLPSNVARAQVQPPAAPSDPGGTVVSTTQINTSWKDNSDNEQGFRVERGTSATNITQVASVGRNVIAHNNTGLTASTTYFYRFRAYNGVGNSFYSPIVSLRTAAPTAPINLTGRVAATNRIDLSWQDNASNESRYIIDRSTTSATSGFAQIATVGANVRDYSNTGLTSGTTYHYRVRADNGAGVSGNSNVVSITLAAPSAPSNLTATALSGSAIRINWQDNSSQETGFKIERSPNGTSGWTEINVVGNGVISFTNNGLASMTRYYYRVRAYNGVGNTAYSNIANATTSSQVVLRAPCRVPGLSDVIFPYESAETDLVVTLPIGPANRFTLQEDRGQPRWFSPGKGAFRVDLNNAADTWTLGSSSQSVNATTPQCSITRDGKRETVTVGGVPYPVGIDHEGVLTAGRGTTQTSPSGPALPDGTIPQVVAGATAGSLSVSHDGAASYRIPIDLPTTRGGWGPQALALAYNSQGGNGIAGVGWSLTGVSQITRCALHTTYGDQEIAAFEWEEPAAGARATYALCMDGKRLIAVPGQSVVNEYRLEDDPGYRIKVTARDPADQSPVTFTVEDGQGNIYTYGGFTSATATRLEGAVVRHSRTNVRPTQLLTKYSDEAPDAEQPKRFAWLMTDMRNRYNQFVSYQYRQPDANESNEDPALKGVERLLSQISYQPGFFVSFTYERRPDALEQYVRGMRLVGTQRLKAITLNIEGRNVWEYRFTYATSPVTERSLLASAQHCDAQGKCKAPLSFRWQDPDMTYRPTNKSIFLGVPFWSETKNLTMQVVDLNNDGKDDIILSRQGANADTRVWHYSLSDGDGFPDGLRSTDIPSGTRIASNDDTSGSWWQEALSTSPGWLNVGKWTVYSELITTDLNGDGKPEISIRDGAQRGYQFWNLNVATGLKTPFSMAFDKLMPYMGDINGDGLQELVQKICDNSSCTRGRWRILINNREVPGVFSAADSFDIPGDKHHTLGNSQMVDWDGDGQLDFMIQHYDMLGTYGVLNAGFSGANGPRWRESYAYPPGDEWRMTHFDPNGDGTSDTVWVPGREIISGLTWGHGVVPRFMEHTGAGLREHRSLYPDPPEFLPGTMTRNPDWETWRLAESVIVDGWQRSTGEYGSPGPDFVDSGLRVGDIDGDGRQELLVLGDRYGCWGWAHTCFRAQMQPRPAFMVKLGYDRQWKHVPIQGTRASTNPLLNGTLEWGPYVDWMLGNRIDRAFGYKLTRLADLDGDGIPEIIQPRVIGEPTGTNTNVVLEVYKRGVWNPATSRHEAQKPDLLQSVTDSLGAVTEVTYKPMSDRTVHTPETSTSICRYPFQCATKGSFLVSQVRRPTGVAAQPMAAEDHTYAGGASDMAGRGWLGMSSHRVHYPDRRMTTTYKLNNITRFGKMYPYAQMVAEEITEHAPTLDDLRGDIQAHRHEQTYQMQNLSTEFGRMLIRPLKNCEAWVEVKSMGVENKYSNVCTEFTEYDTWGFARTQTRTGGFETLVKTTTFDHSRAGQTPRILAVVTQEVEKATANGRDETRTHTIVPDSFGMPQSEVIEPQSPPGMPPLTLTTTYVRDPSDGLPLQISIAGDAYAPVPGTTSWTAQPQTRTTYLEYDGYGNKIGITNALGHQERYVFDAAHRDPVAHLDADGILTTFTYDGFFRELRKSSPVIGDTQKSYSYDLTRPATPLIIETNRYGLGGATRLANSRAYADILGRTVLEETLQPRNRTVNVVTKYDVQGRVSGVSAPRFNGDMNPPIFGTRDYDNRDRITKRVEPDEKMQFTVSYRGLKSVVTNGVHNKHAVIRDPLGVPLESQSLNFSDQLLGKVTFVYGPFGVIESMTKELNGVQVATTSTYDRLGRRLVETDRDRGVNREARNAFGELIHQTDAAGSTETRSYDLLGRITRKQNSDGTTTYAYDQAVGGIGEISSSTSPDQIVLQQRFDQLGRPTVKSVTVPNLSGPGNTGTLETETVYDSLGRIGRVLYPAATPTRRFETVYQYSQYEGGEPIGLTDGAGNLLWQIEDWSAFGTIAQEYFGNKLRATREINIASGLLESIHAGFVTDATPYPESSPGPVPPIPFGTPLVQGEAYAYDNAHNLESRQEFSKAINDIGTDIDLVEDYSYDGLNRLYSWRVTAGNSTPVRFTYDFDDYGNLKGRTTPSGVNEWAFSYTDSRPHAITSATMGGVTRTFSYDARGRRIADGDRTVVYTDFDLPRRLMRGTTTVASFEYDAFNDRVRKRSNNEEIVTIGDLYERRAPAAALTSALHTYRVPGPDGRTVAEIEWDALGQPRTDGQRYLHADRLGSSAMVTGTAGTLLLGRNRFEPYGNMVSPANPIYDASSAALTGGTRYGFTGQEHDDELGLINMNGRIYDPRSVSFFTADPVISKPAWAHAFHPYSYVTNNPVNAIDPTGFTDDEVAAPSQGGEGEGTGGEEELEEPEEAEDEVAAEGFTSLGIGEDGGMKRPRKQRTFRVPSKKLQFVRLGGCGPLKAGYRCFGIAQYTGEGPYKGKYFELVEKSNSARNGIDNPDLNWLGRKIDEKFPGMTMNPDTKKAIEGASIILNVSSPLTRLIIAKALAERFGINMFARAWGRLGHVQTRKHIAEVATELERRGWTITHGGQKYVNGKRLKEEWIPGPGGKKKGGAWADITATKNGKVLRINTVDTYKDGITMTKREADAATRIRTLRPGEHLLTLPKPKR